MFKQIILYFYYYFKPELDEFLQDLDEDVEGMQSTIYLLQNELQKYKSQQNINNTVSKETNSTFVNGIKSDDVTINSPSVSIIDVPTQLVKTKSDNKLNKHDKIKDLKHANDSKSHKSKVKKSRQPIIDAVDQIVKNHKAHKSKHKSDGSKNEEKHNKSEKRLHKKDKIVNKKSKNEQPSVEVLISAVATVNGIPNGS